MDIGASVLARLRNKARQSGMPFQIHLQLFCQEEFLRRLSLSKYADSLILKGGLFIFTLSGFESRATFDIDFLLRQLPGSIDDIRRIIIEIISFSNNEAMVDKWQQFIKRTELPNIEFKEVIALLNLFLHGVWKAIMDEDEWSQVWDCQSFSWNSNVNETLR